MDRDESTEIVIVGGGITGISIADSLSEWGMTDVVVLEKDNLASASTGKSAGIVETQYLNEFDVELRARSLRAFERLASETRAVFNDVGYVRLLLDPSQESAFRESIEIQRRHGVDDARFLEPDDLQNLVPDANVSDVHGAIYGPSDGYADPYTITHVLTERARERGVDVRTGVEVTDVVTRGNEVAGVETTEGRIDCETVVNAAGPWASWFAERVELDLPAAPYRRQVLVGEPDGGGFGYTVPTVMEYTPAGNKPGLYFRDEGGENLMMGIHREVSAEEQLADPDHYKEDFDEEFALEVFDLLDHRAPSFADISVVNGWSGIYTITPDTEPILDCHPSLDDYYIAAGFSGKGFQIGPMVGEIMADLILHGEPRVMDDVSSVRLDRFEDGG